MTGMLWYSTPAYSALCVNSSCHCMQASLTPEICSAQSCCVIGLFGFESAK